MIYSIINHYNDLYINGCYILLFIIFVICNAPYLIIFIILYDYFYTTKMIKSIEIDLLCNIDYDLEKIDKIRTNELINMIEVK